MPSSIACLDGAWRLGSRSNADYPLVVLPSRRIGALLAAVGNHEATAHPHVLRAHNGATTDVVTAALSPDLTKDLVAGTLAEIARAGKVRDEKLSDEPYNGGLT